MIVTDIKMMATIPETLILTFFERMIWRLFWFDSEVKFLASTTTSQFPVGIEEKIRTIRVSDLEIK